jgi:alpha-L-fucosidase
MLNKSYMKKIIYFLLCFFVQMAYCFGQSAPNPYGVLPSERQLNWHEVEMYCIIHFGVDTYTDKEWGFGDEDPKILNPTKFDAMQIVGAAKAGGFKGIIVVAKHHDGLCIWPTKTTEHNITNTSWKNGKGDMVKEYQIACEKLGMQMGLYCSPWDRNSALYGKPEYVEIYRKQLKELYSNYGKLFMSWHDGANGGDGYYGGANEPRKIDRTTYYNWPVNWEITRKMQPMANLFGDVGPDVRWVGNEEGHAGETSWATYTPTAPDKGKIPSNGYSNYLEAIEGTRNGKYWMPAECDVPIRPGWFYHASQNGKVKSPYTLLDLYYKSVGRGANLDLGLSPNRDGLLDQEDVAALKGFGTIIKETFKVNLAKDAKLTASNVRGSNQKLYGPGFLTDNSRYTYWSTDDAIHNPTLSLSFPASKSFNVIRLRENIKLGQRIEAFEIDAFTNGKWQKIAAATSIGSNRLIRLPQTITASKVRLRITKSPVSIALSDFGLFKEPVHLTPPIITRNKEDLVLNSTSSDLSKSQWTLMADSSGQNPLYAIDENPGSLWTTINRDSTAQFEAKSLSVDLGKITTIKSFTYLPRQDKKLDGIVDQYTFEVSVDGKTWNEVAAGEFSNIRANPISQLIELKAPASARYFRFTGKRSVKGNGISVAELGINSN